MELRDKIRNKVLQAFMSDKTVDEATDAILALFNIVGQSEQLPSCDKCGYYIHTLNKTCLREGCENY